MSAEAQLVAVERVDAERLLLSVNEESAPDQFAAVVDAVETDYKQAKERRERLNKLLIEVVKRHRGGVTIGETRYWLSHPKTVRPRSIIKLMRRILELIGGDEDRFSDTLRSDPFKLRQCRSILKEEFGQYFKTEIRNKLESGEVAPKELTSADERWMK